jgi:hypothetical protein
MCVDRWTMETGKDVAMKIPSRNRSPISFRWIHEESSSSSLSPRIPIRTSNSDAMDTSLSSVNCSPPRRPVRIDSAYLVPLLTPGSGLDKKNALFWYRNRVTSKMRLRQRFVIACTVWFKTFVMKKFDLYTMQWIVLLLHSSFHGFLMVLVGSHSATNIFHIAQFFCM